MGNLWILSLTIILVIFNLFISETDGSALTLRNLCQAYGKGGIAHPEPSNTLDTCRTRCRSDTDCADTIFISIFKCCLKYDHLYTYSFACRYLSHLPSSGCKKDKGDVDLSDLMKLFTRPTRRTTPAITTTTTTTTPAPVVVDDEVDDGNGTTASMTTEAGDDSFVEEEGIPDPEFPERCEERVVTGEGDSWAELMTMLKNESAHYFCHKACKAPPKPRFYWLKNYLWPQEYEAPTNCKPWGHYDSSLCASFLELSFKQPITKDEGQFILTVCSLPPEEDSTESSVTGATTAGT